MSTLNHGKHKKAYTCELHSRGDRKDIRRKTRRLFTAEQKVLIVMEALRAEISVAELCRKHQINESQFYKWIGSPKR